MNRYRVMSVVWLCLLLGLLANTVLSSWLLSRWPSNRAPMGGTPSSEKAGGAWPVPPPGEWVTPWPSPTSWSEWQGVGLQGVDARKTEDRQSKFSMAVLLSGWLLATHYSQQIWWPGDDPAFAYAGPTEIKCRVLPRGMIGNTLIFAFAAWAMLFAVPGTIRGYIRHARSARRLCLHCAYPIGESPVCTECGRAVLPAGATK